METYLLRMSGSVGVAEIIVEMIERTDVSAVSEATRRMALYYPTYHTGGLYKVEKNKDLGLDAGLVATLNSRVVVSAKVVA